MQPYTGPDAPDVPPPTNNEEFLKALIPTYLSMDIDGRVMRMDSFSKVIAPGTRVGWITASKQIVERFIRHNECSNQNPSGISQLILYKLLDESWGHDGYLQWLINLRLQYTKRRDVSISLTLLFILLKSNFQTIRLSSLPARNIFPKKSSHGTHLPQECSYG